MVLGAAMLGGNPFFTQLRPGKDEKIFRLIKFRTMTCEKDKEGNLLPDEQRLCRYGKLLRSTSLDELPELWNIFKGDMSIIGPRPALWNQHDLIAERDFDTEFNVTNLTSETANLTVEVSFACPVTSVITQKLVLNANESIMKLVKDDVLKAVNSEWVYIRFITDKDLSASIDMRNVSPCVNAVAFDWNTGAKLNAGESQWYEMDITTLKQNKKHLGLSFTNHADAVALVNVEVALDCEGTILPITLPIPKAFLNTDGISEGIEHDRLPIVGVQWHPERIKSEFTTTSGDQLLAHFLQRYA